MKKLVVFAAMITIVASLATAEIGLAVGAKGAVGLSLGTTFVDGLFPSTSKQAPTVNAGGAVFARYELPFALPLDSKLGVQLDVGFNANNGSSMKTDLIILEQKDTVSFNTLDIPLLITYRLPINSLLDVRAGVGPNFGIALGKIKATTKENGVKVYTGEDDAASKLLIGLMANVGVGINLGPGVLLADVRFLNDFTKLAAGDKNNKTDLLTRRNLSLSVGYEMKF